jgi:hypothetical protein
LLAFVRYQLLSLIQSLKFIPPVTVFLAWVFILYAYKYVPILSSYGVSSIALYFIMSWISMIIFKMEEESEKHILFTHLGSKVGFLLGKWMTILIVMFPLLLFAIYYPIITESFKGQMSLVLYGFSFYSHIVFAAFGILVGTLFSATKLATKKYAWLSAVFVVVVSLSSKSIIEMTLVFKWLLWIFPPVFEVIDHMEGGESIILKEKLLLNFIFVVGYILIATLLNIFLFRRKER